MKPTTGGLVVGRIPALECLRGGKRKPRRLYLLESGKDLETIRAAAKGVSIETRNRKDLDSLSGNVVHQGVVLEADPLPVLSVEEWLPSLVGNDAVAVVLDGVEDPHNFGAIVRNAAAFGANAVIFTKDRAAPLSPAALKSAAGAMEYVDLVRATNLSRALAALKDANFWIAGLLPNGKDNLWKTDLTGRIALVIGGEGKGLRRLTAENCDFQVAIPLAGPLESLNASAAAAVALAECRRQRTAPK